MDLPAAHILHLLRERHPSQEWACFEELSNGTGSTKSRQFDLFVLHLWPSRGFRSLGYEVKVSRKDYARELEDPTKRKALEAVAGECFFATPAGLVRPDEMPEGWGLIEVHGGSLKIKKQPLQRTIETWPKSFVASLARRVADPALRPVPTLAWEFAGRPIGLADLDRLLEKRSNMWLKRAKEAEDTEQKHLQQYKEQMQRLIALRAAVMQTFGYNAQTPEGFQRAVARRGATLRPDQRNRLLQLQREIQAILEDTPSLLIEETK